MATLFALVLMLGKFEACVCATPHRPTDGTVCMTAHPRMTWQPLHSSQRRRATPPEMAGVRIRLQHLPVIVGYTVYVYRVFGGKARAVDHD